MRFGNIPLFKISHEETAKAQAAFDRMLRGLFFSNSIHLWWQNHCWSIKTSECYKKWGAYFLLDIAVV